MKVQHTLVLALTAIACAPGHVLAEGQTTRRLKATKAPSEKMTEPPKATNAPSEKGTKASKTTNAPSDKGTKAPKATNAPKVTKVAKNTKAPKNTKALTPKKGKASSCKKVKNYKASKDSRLDGIIKSLVESQDFSSYCRSDFMVAREWFLNMANHPTDLPTDDDKYNNYMTVRLSFSIFILISEFDQYQLFACQYL